jgi:hypothetical protein
VSTFCGTLDDIDFLRGSKILCHRCSEKAIYLNAAHWSKEGNWGSSIEWTMLGDNYPESGRLFVGSLQKFYGLEPTFSEPDPKPSMPVSPECIMFY